ncbi:TonB-dependent receptor family protein [Flagellimonas sp. DF-77]|uniref:TonB-dependent receptor domain-containing protein n=1 Tax=Flagellimonas algarum TaxID=3230298 RepID=UPI003396AD3C
MKYLPTVLISLCLGLFQLQAQDFSIAGKVVDSNDEIIPFANILLLNAADSTFVKGTSANDHGLFVLEAIPPNLYLLQASYIGRGSKPLALDVKADIRLGALVIPKATEDLDEVVVTARRPTVKRLTDRLVFEVENTVVSQGTSWDILRNTPGVILNRDALQIRGNTANVYLNGRRVQLSEQEVKDLLEGLTGSAVKSVEVYTNPPASFDAEEGAVINILTNKNVATGYKGSLEARLTQGVFPKYGFGTSHFLKTDKLNLFANYNYNSRKNNIDVDKGINFINDSGVFSRWSTDENQIKEYDTHSLNLNLDIDADERNELNFSTNILLAPDQIWQRDLFAEIRDPMLRLDSTFTTSNSGAEDKRNLAFDLSWDHKFKKPGAKLKFNGHYTNYFNTYSQNIDSRYFDQNGDFLRNFAFQTEGEQQIDIITAQLDFQTPIGSSSFEAGTKISVINSDSNVDFSNFSDTNEVANPSLSDAFVYEENVYAAYMSYVKSWEKWSVKLGLRGELTDAQGTSLTMNEVNTQDFFEPFPSVYVLYNLNDAHSFSFDYGRNVQRPRYNDLNPFRLFFNENDFLEGNPRLQPNFSNNFNFNYTLNGEFFFDIYYRDNGNYISELVFQDNTALTLRELKQNVLESTSYGLDFTLSKSIADPWFLYSYVSVFHEDETFLAVESEAEQFENAIDGFYIYVANYLTLSKDGSFTGELTFSHFSKYLFGSYVQAPITNLTLGLRKSLWNDRAILSLSAEDLLGEANGRYTSRYLNQDNNFLSVPETQFIRVGFTYNFGNFRLEDNQREIDKKERERINGE